MIRTIPDRALRLLPLLASPNDGEALAACRAIERALAAAGCDLHDVVAVIEAASPTAVQQRPARPASHFDLARAVREMDRGRLSIRERAFAGQMCRLGNRSPTPPQAAWLADLYAKLAVVAA